MTVPARVRWIAWRNRVLGSARFQAFAAMFPLVRGVARRRSRALFDLVAGFTYSQILLAVVDSGLLDRLGEGPCDAGAIAAATGLSQDAASRHLRAAKALDIAEEIAPGQWMLGQQGAVLQANSGLQPRPTAS